MSKLQSKKEIETKARASGLRQTIREVVARTNGLVIRPSGKLRAELHEKLELLIQAKIEWAYEVGFKASHALCRRYSKDVPKKLKHDVMFPNSSDIFDPGVTIKVVSRAK